MKSIPLNYEDADSFIGKEFHIYAQTTTYDGIHIRLSYTGYGVFRVSKWLARVADSTPVYEGKDLKEAVREYNKLLGFVGEVV